MSGRSRSRLASRHRTGPCLDPAAFRGALVAWFEREGADYPWRRTSDPWAILVSEVMLQQTRIATVLGKGYFTRFLARFPDPASLAAADDRDLLRAWEGLGYYRRARLLRETARTLVERHDGVFPADPQALLALPGVGRYTAGAVLAFAFDAPAPLVDGNVARVLARLCDVRQPVDSAQGQAVIWQLAADLLDRARPRLYNSALMELGQTACRPGVPDCGRCAVKAFCASPDPARLPARKPRPQATAVTEHAVLCRRADGALLLQQARGRREGLWQLPLRAAAAVAGQKLLGEFRYSITRYRVTLRVHACRPSELSPADPAATEAWHAPADLAALPMAAPFRRALRVLLALPPAAGDLALHGDRDDPG